MIDWLVRLYRNTLFRLTLLTAFLFVTGSLIALGYTYYATISYELRRVNTSLIAEAQELTAMFEAEGISAVSREVTLRSSAMGEGLYLLSFGPLATGNINGLDTLTEGPLTRGPERGLLPDTQREYNRFTFSYALSDEEGTDIGDRRAFALATPLIVDGVTRGTLVLARDVETTLRNAERIRSAIVFSALIAFGFGLLSAAFVSQRFSKRIETFNKLATDVRAGNMKVRAERNYSEDELDLLAENLNDMLDHIDQLMAAMRYAGDSIAHDLRSPLTRLRTRLETAAAEADSDSADILASSAEDASQLLQTFDSVLRIARLESADRREPLVVMDPAPLLEDIAELYEPAFEDAGLTFETDIVPNTRIAADRGLVSQAVSNLIENAIKYVPEGGRVELSLRRNRLGQPTIAITDDGPGIPPHMRNRVRERFVRLEESRSRPGSGLGLSLVEAVAEVHKAEFVIEDGFGDLESGGTVGMRAALVFPKVRSRVAAGRSATPQAAGGV